MNIIKFYICVYIYVCVISLILSTDVSSNITVLNCGNFKTRKEKLWI